jgi:hypothetical protein
MGAKGKTMNVSAKEQSNRAACFKCGSEALEECLELRLLYHRPTRHGGNVHFQTAEVASESLCKRCIFHSKQVSIDNPMHVKRTDEAWFERACAMAGERYAATEKAEKVVEPFGLKIGPVRLLAEPPKPDTSTPEGLAIAKAGSILNEAGIRFDPRIRKSRKPRFVYDVPKTNDEGEPVDASVFDGAIPWAEAVQPAPSRTETDLDSRDLIKAWLRTPDSNGLRPLARRALELWSSNPKMTQRELESRTGMPQQTFCDAKKNALNRAKRQS